VHLLYWAAVAGVAWVDGLARRKTFVLSVIKPDAIFAQPPAQINFLIVNARGKVQ
jgi:hypothetical protein